MSWGTGYIWHELGLPTAKGWSNGSASAAQVLAGVNRRRHDGRFNVVFCDAHVETLRVQDLFDPRKDQQLMRWNPDHPPHKEEVMPGLLH